jgi:hypothetical protein
VQGAQQLIIIAYIMHERLYVNENATFRVMCGLVIISLRNLVQNISNKKLGSISKRKAMLHKALNQKKIKRIVISTNKLHEKKGFYNNF